MMPLEDEHRTQADSSLSRATDIDAYALGLLEELVSARAVKSDERALPLATKVHNLMRVLGLQALEARVEILADLSRIVDQIESFNLFNDGAEEDGAGGVTHPSIELAEGLVGTELWVAEVVARCLGLFGECHNVGRAW